MAYNYYKTEKGRENVKKAVKKYQQTEKGKRTIKKYQESEKGKATRKAYLESEEGRKKLYDGIRRYQKSEKGRAKIKEYFSREDVKIKQIEYRRSERGRAIINAYFATEEGKAARQRAYHRYYLKKKIKEHEISLSKKVVKSISIFGVVLHWIFRKNKI